MRTLNCSGFVGPGTDSQAFSEYMCQLVGSWGPVEEAWLTSVAGAPVRAHWALSGLLWAQREAWWLFKRATFTQVLAMHLGCSRPATCAHGCFWWEVDPVWHGTRSLHVWQRCGTPPHIARLTPSHVEKYGQPSSQAPEAATLCLRRLLSRQKLRWAPSPMHR